MRNVLLTLLVALLLAAPGSAIYLIQAREAGPAPLESLQEAVQGRFVPGSWMHDLNGDKIDDRFPEDGVFSIILGFNRDLHSAHHNAMGQIDGLRIMMEWDLVDGAWAFASRAAIDELAALPFVNRIEWDHHLEPQLDLAAGAIQAADTRASLDYAGVWRGLADREGVLGDGVTIALIDGGIDDTHPALDDLDDNPDTVDPKVTFRTSAWGYAVAKMALSDYGGQDINATPPYLPLVPNGTIPDGTVPTTANRLSLANITSPTSMPHATSLAGAMAGTGAIGAGMLEPAYLYAGVAPRAQLADINVYLGIDYPCDAEVICSTAGYAHGQSSGVQVGSLNAVFGPLAGASDDAGGPTVATAITGLEIVKEYNDDNPDNMIRVALMPLLDVGSCGRNNSGTLLETAVDALAQDNNVTVIISVGQGRGENGVCAPANVPRALTVGAYDHQATADRSDDVVWSFSDRPNGTQRQLAKPELYAPGVGVTTPRSNPAGYYTVTGSSVSAALVAGAAALVVEVSDEQLVGMAVKTELIQQADGSVDSFSYPAQYEDDEPEDPAPDGRNDAGTREGWSRNWGFGIVNVRDAVCSTGDCPLDWEALNTGIERFIDDPWPLTARVGEDVALSGRVFIDDVRANEFWANRDAGEFYQNLGPAGKNIRVNFAFTSTLVDPFKEHEPGDFSSVATTKTGSDGRFTLDFEVPDNTPPGPRYCVVYTDPFSGTPVRDALRHSRAVPCIINILSSTTIDLDMCEGDKHCTPEHPVISFQDDPQVDLLRGRATLYDGAGDPLERAEVRVQWAGAQDVFQDLIVTTAEGSGEVLIKLPVSGEAGTFPLILSYAPPPGSFHEASSFALPITVALGTQLDMAIEGLPPGSTLLSDGSPMPLQFTGRLTTLAGDPVPGVEVDLKATNIAGKVFDLVDAAVTADDGTFNAIYDARQLTNGIFELYTTYGGLELPGQEDIFILLPTESYRLPITIVHQPRVELDDGQAIYRGEEASLTGYMMSPAGRPLGGRNLTAELLGAAPVSDIVRTQQDGEIDFKFEVPHSVGLGEATFRVRFAGADGLSPAVDVTKVEVRGRSELTVFEAQAARGKPIDLAGFLYDDSGRPIVGAPVDLTWGSDSVGTTTTDSLGRYAITYQVPDDQRVGPVIIRAAFDGVPFIDGATAQNIVGVVVGTTLQVAQGGESANGVIELDTRIVDQQGNPLTDQQFLELYLSNPRPEDNEDLTMLGPLDLSQTLAPELVLRHAYDFSNRAGVSDGARVVLSLDDGKNWAPIEPRDGYPVQHVATLDGEAGWSGATSGWFPREINLTAYAGEEDVRLRWRTATSPLANDIQVGLDLVQLSDGDDLLFYDDFERFGSKDQSNHWRLPGDQSFVVGRESLSGDARGVLATNLDGEYDPGLDVLAESPKFRIPDGQSYAMFRYRLDVGDEGDLVHFIARKTADDERTLLSPYRDPGATTLPATSEWRWLVYEVPKALNGQPVVFQFDFQANDALQGGGLMIDEFQLLAGPSVQYALHEGNLAQADIQHWVMDGFQAGSLFDVDTYERVEDNVRRYTSIDDASNERRFAGGPQLLNPPFTVKVLDSSSDVLTVYAQGLVALGDTRAQDPNAPCLAFLADNPGQGCPLGNADWELGTALIAPAWDAGLLDEKASIRTETFGHAPDRQFVIEWRDLKAPDANQPQGSRFKLILHERGDMEMVYGAMTFGGEKHDHDLGAKATVGLRDPISDRTFNAHVNDGVLSETFRVDYSRVQAPVASECSDTCFGIQPKRGGGYAANTISEVVYDTGFDLGNAGEAFLVVRQLTDLGRNDQLIVSGRSVAQSGWRPLEAIAGGSSSSSGTFTADEPGGYETVVYDMTALVGSRAQVRFQIASDASGQDVGVVLREVLAIVEPRSLQGTNADDFESYLDTSRGGADWWSARRSGSSPALPPWTWSQHGSGAVPELGDHYLRLGGSGPLSANSNYVLTSPPVDLASSQYPTLRFWSHFDFQDDKDGALIEISTDGGATYRPLTPDDQSYDGFVPMLSGPGWVGPQFGFRTDRFDLTPYAGENVRVRLEYKAGDNPFGAQWIVDDLLIHDRIGDTGAIFSDDGSYSPDRWHSRPGAWTEHPLVSALEHGREGLEPAAFLPATGAKTTHRVALPAGTPLGLLSATLLFPGVEDTFGGSVHVSQFFVQRETLVTDLTISNNEDQGDHLIRGGTYLVKGAVQGRDGTPVSGGLVQISFDGVGVGSATTDASGRFQSESITLPGATTLGFHRVAASYTGEPSKYILASESSKLVAVKGHSALTIIDQVAEGTEFRVTLELRDDHGNPLPETGIIIRIPGVNAPQSLVTDGLGQARFTTPVALEEATTVEFLATSPGTEFLLGSETEKQSVVPAANIDDFPWWIVAIAVVVLAIIAVALFIILRRRSARIHLAENLVEQIEKIQYRLDAGDPVRATIYELYRGFLSALHSAGLGRADSETPQEVENALRQTMPERVHSSISTITGLFQEARYSEHPLAEGDRGRAQQGLSRLRSALAPVAEETE